MRERETAFVEGSEDMSRRAYRIGVARANRLPNIQLTGSGGSSALAIGQVLPQLVTAARTHNHDVLLLTRAGLFVTELKGWHGTLRGNSQRWQHGIRNVAVHKALWLPPAPRSAFDVDDLDGALERFSDLNFFMVHAGAAFLDRTADLLARHRNLHANINVVFFFEEKFPAL